LIDSSVNIFLSFSDLSIILENQESLPLMEENLFLY